MAKLRDALKYLGTKVNGVEPKGHYITDIIKNIADDYQGGGGGTRYTLTYALGAYGEGNVPDPVTVDAGTEVNIEFENNIPYMEGFVFIGWDTDYEAGEPTYTAEGTNTITMTENVTLYPIFANAQTQYLLTYSLGQYGAGRIPNPVRVNEGETVQINFDDVPHYIGGGKEFVGWATKDGADNPTYTEDGTDEITMNADVTLYPVFVAEPVTQYTLTYSLGNDATGSVPSSVTEDEGTTVNIDFTTYPSCMSDPTKEFIGWSTTDESSTADYSEDGITSITMYNDVTLYPVFAAVQPVPFTIDNTNHNVDILVQDENEETILTVSAGSLEYFTPNAGDNYHLIFASDNFGSVVFSGSIEDGTYTNENLQVGDDYSAYRILTPNGSSEWTFANGEGGSITAAASQV